MPLRRGKPVTLRPTGLSDSMDGTNAFPGAMGQLANLIPDPTTDRCWVCRPAATQIAGYPGSIAGAGFVSAFLVVGDVAYGMVASDRNPGYDEPFAVNLLTGAVLPVSGITAGNVPVSPPSAGDWTPPIIAQVASRVIVTHPGFPGGTVKFGWFDVSELDTGITGDVASGSAVIRGAPATLGLQPGLALSGTGIPAGATVVSTAAFVLTTSGDTNSNTTLDSLADTTGVAAGQVVAGVGIVAGTTVVSVDSPTQVTLSVAATASATVAVTFTGATITMSAAATGTHNLETITVTGGTAAAPQWAAGDTNVNPLPSIPVGVAQFNGRAYYAVGKNGIRWSDSLLPCQISDNLVVQALTTNDGLAVTAIGPLMEISALTGGIVQGLIAFEGVSKMQQITGDQTTSNLSMNALPVATGTLAPLSVTPSALGLMFVSPQGVRYVDFSGRISPPIGAAGSGVAAPFINALHPSRICAAANGDVLRFSVETQSPSGQPAAEYWYDLTRKCWSGPHTFASSLIQPWGATFACAQQGVNAALFQSDGYQSAGSGFSENGADMAWLWRPTPLPDNGDVAANALVDMTLALALQAGQSITLTAYDMNGGLLDSTSITAAGTPPIWGEFIWGEAQWGGAAQPFQQQWINWNVPLVFKQLVMQVTGSSSASLRIGNLYMRYEVLGYIIELLLPGPVSTGVFALTSDAGIPLTSDVGVALVGG